MNFNKKVVRANAADFTKLTPEKAQDQFIELIKICQCIDVALIAQLNLDARFKNPIIGNHLKRIKDSAQAIKTELRSSRYGFSAKETEYAEEVACEIYNFLSTAVRFGKDGISELNKYLTLQLDQPEKFNAFVTETNTLISTGESFIRAAVVEYSKQMCERFGVAGGPIYFDLLDDIVNKLKNPDITNEQN